MYFLLFSLFSLGVSTSPDSLEEPQWKPDAITKETILEDHLKLNNEPLYTGLNALAFVTPWNPRGYMLARKRAAHLSYVSPVWFELEPVFEETGNDLLNMKITGRNNINEDFIRYLRKANPFLKIVPRFLFPRMMPTNTEKFVTSEVLIQKVAQMISNFCNKYGFDGALLDIYGTISTRLKIADTRIFAIEAAEQLGQILKKNDLIAILSIAPPVSATDKSDDDKNLKYYLTSEECQRFVDAYDHLQLWTYSDNVKRNREHIGRKWILDNIDHCGSSSKIMIGINYFGVEFNLKDWRSDEYSHDQVSVNSKRYLQVLKEKDSVLTYNPDTNEHDLILERNNTLIIFPSLTSLESRIRLAKAKNVAISYWDYGQGLDYFTNLA